MTTRWIQGVGAGALLMLAAAQAGAQPVYRCAGKDGAVYSNMACPGARDLRDKQKPVAKRNAVPPQDRARAARRAELTPEERQECIALDKAIPEQEAFVRTRGAALTPDEERPLVKGRMRFRALRC